MQNQIFMKINHNYATLEILDPKHPKKFNCAKIEIYILFLYFYQVDYWSVSWSWFFSLIWRHSDGIGNTLVRDLKAKLFFIKNVFKSIKNILS